MHSRLYGLRDESHRDALFASWHEHAELLDRIEARDGPGAEAVMRSHIGPRPRAVGGAARLTTHGIRRPRGRVPRRQEPIVKVTLFLVTWPATSRTDQVSVCVPVESDAASTVYRRVSPVTLRS